MAYLYASIYRHEVMQTSIFLYTGKLKILTNIEPPLLPFIEAYLYQYMEAFQYHILNIRYFIPMKKENSTCEIASAALGTLFLCCVCV